MKKSSVLVALAKIWTGEIGEVAKKQKTKTVSISSIVRGGAKFKKQWKEFSKMVEGASLILLVSMQREIEKKLKEMKQRGKTSRKR